MRIKIPQLLWYGPSEMALDFPPTWSVFYCPMKGGEKRRLSAQEMERAFSYPIGSKPIHELARGKREIAILFDDMARPTPVYEIIPFLLWELEKAGIQDQQIRFVAALGAHGAQTANDFRKKLGHEVLDRFPVYNHHAFDYCKFIGKTTYGTPVSINQEVMACDLKIGIGCIVPHSFSGFGGGGKIVLPGVAHIDTIRSNHGLIKAHPDCVGQGKIEGNVPRRDIEEATRMVGLDIKIDAILNLKGEIIGLFVGDPISEHHEGMRMAKEVYATTPAKGMDVVVINTYAKANECAIAPFIGIPSLKEEGGDLVIIANEPAGQMVHYLFGEFGRCGEGEGMKLPQPLSNKVRRMIVLSPFKDQVGACFFGQIPCLLWAKTWEEVLGLLKEKWNEGTRVAVYPDGTIQYLREA